MLPKRFFILFFVFFLFVGLHKPALATAILGNNPKNLVEISDNCRLLGEKIDSELPKWADSEPKVHKTYLDALSKIQDLLQKLEKNGYDTFPLSISTKNLADIITKRQEDGQRLTSLLKSAKGTCHASEEEYKKLLKEIRDAWELVKADRMEIKNIWQNQIRPEIRALKKK